MTATNPARRDMATQVRPRTAKDLFGAGDLKRFLLPEHETPKVYAWFQKRHVEARTSIDENGVYHSRDGEHEWRVPYGVRQAMTVPLIHGQIINKYPWYVTWVSPRTGKRYKKRCMHLVSAIDLIATRVQYVDSKASIVSRQVGYTVPPKLRGKFPRPMNGGKMHYWCPFCMDARRYRRDRGGRTFYTNKKFWSDEKQHYVWKEVHLATMMCVVCGCTNQDHRFRVSNQPYEKIRVKKGVRRIRRRRRK
jgi:hypothetical protein